MKINFYLRYHTNFGQSLSLTGNFAADGGSAPDAIPMAYLNEEFWYGTVEVPTTKSLKFRYRYILTDSDGSFSHEGERDRAIDIPKVVHEELHLIDTWNFEGSFENVFYTSPFQKTLLADRENKTRPRAVKEFTHIFKVKAPLLKKNETLYLAGSSIALGDWKEENAMLMAREGNWWTVKVNIPLESFPLQYKYAVYNTKEKSFVVVESGENRQLHGTSNKSLNIIHDGFVRLPNNTWKGAGTAIPVFSLRSKNSFGVGEFTDLKLLIDWAKDTGLKVIQILPVNDTSATHTSADSYPYAAISAFALHPIYINLERVAGKKQAAVIKQLKKKQKELNDLPVLDYEQVMKLKLSTLKELFLTQKEEYLNDPEFYQFFNKNRHWLVPYAAFCYLRDKHGTADSSQWKIHGTYNKEDIEKFVAPKTKHYDEIVIQYFVQYQLHLQLKEATDYAHTKGVILKGDIPIGVYRHSSDVWVEPELFNMDKQAGAPPDDFAVKGQNWGFPTYNWKKMQDTGFAWWRQRFEQMSEYFDAFRIDHILGFFRIWSIPVDAVEGILGFFVPSIPVHKDEFAERNIAFDQERYTRPFINKHILEQLFGETAEQVKEKYLEESTEDRFNFKEEFDTQKKIEAYFATQPQGGENTSIKTGLFDLISNVILFHDPNSEGQGFHFRIGMEKTSSFTSLDESTRHQLKDLYVNYFYQRQDGFWKKEALKKLPGLKESTNMLICGEDLGMVPACVPEVMYQLGILSLEIQRMPKNPAREYFHPNDAPYLSVVTPSTHDMSTIRGWWEEDKVKIQHFFNHELGQWGEAPQVCEAWINKAIILQHLYSPAMWSIFQLQDILGMSETLRRPDPNEERINVPADPKNFWGYRMHIPLEQLIKEKDFNTALKSYIQASGRMN